MSEITRVTAIVLDDDDDSLDLAMDLEDFRLEVLTCRPQKSQEKTLAALFNLIENAAVPIVIVDYRLDVPANVTYRGGSVASGLKDKKPDVPVILLTSDVVMRDLLDRRPASKAVFDWLVLKDRLVANEVADLDSLTTEIVSFANGFEALRLVSNNHDSTSTVDLSAIVGVHNDLLGGAGEWFRREIESDTPDGWGRWVVNTFLKTPGPLFNASEAAASLGITKSAFEQIENSERLLGVKYEGIFSGFAPRWWREGLREIRQDVHSALGLENRASSSEIAFCRWCGGAVTRACSICRKGCHEAHSLASSKVTGRWGLPLVVCFNCVSEGRVDETGIDPDSVEIMRDIVNEDLIPSISAERAT